MNGSRRRFLQAVGAGAMSMAFPVQLRAESIGKIREVIAAKAALSIDEAASDESIWTEVRSCFDFNQERLNLVTGVRGSAPKVVTDAVFDTYQRMNSWRPGGDYVGNRREEVRKRVAGHIGCSPDEVALTRNTTDGVTTVISGLPLKAGDEILATNQEHLPYVGMLYQRARRDGVEIRLLDLPTPARTAADLAEAFEKAITPKTRLALVCHVYLSGQTPPVRRICDNAHQRGVQVLVDGALAFGHLVANVKDLDCDYYAGSFHKWACGPSGTGFFYAKPEHVAALLPLYGYFDHERMQPANDSALMRKFESFGTHPAALTYSVGQMIEFREAIGQERIQARLHYLKRRWAEQVAKEPRIRFFASFEPELSCSLLTFQVDGMAYRDITVPLREKHTVYMGGAHIEGVLGKRDTWKEVVFVNTAVFHTPAEMDRAAAALLEVVRNG